jgi:hypothetical protein
VNFSPYVAARQGKNLLHSITSCVICAQAHTLRGRYRLAAKKERGKAAAVLETFKKLVA